MRKQTIALIFFLFFSVLFALLPQSTQADSVVEKFPTSTSVVVAGWTAPIGAYVRDFSYTNTSTDGAWQAYSGFGFNFNATDTIDSVHVNFARKFDFATSPATGLGEVFFVVCVNNSVGWNPVYFDEDQLSVGADSASSFILDQAIISADITDFYESIANLNNLSVSIYVVILTDSANFYLDVISVEVAYTTPTEENTAKWILIGTMFSTPTMLALALHRRKQRKP